MLFTGLLQTGSNRIAIQPHLTLRTEQVQQHPELREI
jgi:hypothetical protein